MMPEGGTDVFITVDVEHGGSAALRKRRSDRMPPATLDCVAGGRAWGLPFIVDTLQEHGLRATFFVEPLSGFYFGERPMGDAVAMLLARGMDVQMHAHPAWLVCEDGRERPDALHAFPAREQEAILRKASALLQGYGARIRAFRAGGFGANNQTYRVLEGMGIPYSSSYNLSYLGGDCRIELTGDRNDAFVQGGVVEVPITNYLVRDPRRAFRRTRKHFQVGSTSARHAKAILDGAAGAGMRSVNILLHNFEFVRRERRDWHAAPFEPHRAVAEAFREICAHLAEGGKRRLRTVTFSDLDATWMGTGRGRADFLPAAPGFYWPL